MSADIISLSTKGPWVEEQAAKRKARRADARKKRMEASLAVENHRTAIVEVLEEVKALVLAGKFEGLVIFGRDPKTKSFFNDFVLDETAVSRTDYYGYAGLLDTVSMELKQSATMAPALMNDGSILDPYLEQPDFDEYVDGEYE